LANRKRKLESLAEWTSDSRHSRHLTEAANLTPCPIAQRLLEKAEDLVGGNLISSDRGVGRIRRNQLVSKIQLFGTVGSVNREQIHHREALGGGELSQSLLRLAGKRLSAETQVIRYWSR